MRTGLYVLGIAVLSVGLHLLIGWPATVLAGCVAAGAARRILVGMIGVGLGWASLVGYTFVVNDEATVTMLSFLGEATGGVPAAVLVALPVLIGALWGGAGALLGGALLDGWRGPR